MLTFFRPKWLTLTALSIYTIITLISTFTILAALYVVTAGLFTNLFEGLNITVSTVALGLFVFISSLLIIGRYKFLEISLKFIITILFIALITTTALVIFKGKVASVPDFEAPTIFNEVGILFLIGLVGWMPTAVEASGWVSLWSIEKHKMDKKKLPLKEALL